MAPQAQIDVIDGYDRGRHGRQAGEHGRRVRRGHVSGRPGAVSMMPEACRTASARRRSASDSRPTARRSTSPTTSRGTSSAPRRPSRSTAAASRRTSAAPPTSNQACATSNDCPARTPASATTPAAAPAPQRRRRLRRRQPARASAAPTACRSSSASRSTSPAASTRDPAAGAILDGKNLFNTAARDASVTNTSGSDNAAPLFNDPRGWRDSTGTQVIQPLVPGAWSARRTTRRTSPARRATPTSADRTDAPGTSRSSAPRCGTRWTCAAARASRPGTCSNDTAKECFFDAACGDGAYCKANPSMIPPNVTGADRERYFNPMLTVHWNGDRDEVEDFEHTYPQPDGRGRLRRRRAHRHLRGGADPAERAHHERRRWTSTRTSPRRTGTSAAAGGANVGIRLTHMADFVYSLTEFPVNPNGPSPAAQRGARLFNDSQTHCASCHQGGPPGQGVLHRQEAAHAARRSVAARRAGREQPVPAPRRRHGEHVRRDGPRTRSRS